MYGDVIIAQCAHLETYVCDHQLIAVVDTGHADLPLADEGEVIGVGGDEESLCS